MMFLVIHTHTPHIITGDDISSHKHTHISTKHTATMPNAKVHPPNPLLPKSLMQIQFDIWLAELLAWLAADDTQSLSLYQDQSTQNGNQRRPILTGLQQSM